MKILFQKNKNKGFTLIEIIVAFTIITVTFFSLIYSFPYGLKITKSAETSTVASYLAQSKIEELFASGYNNLGLGNIESKQRISADPNNFLYNYFRDVNIEFVDIDLNHSVTETGLKKININIYYQDSISKNENIFNLSALMAKL